MENAVRLSGPKGKEKRELENRDGALRAFGQATHAIADFYSHTNRVEIHADAGVRPPHAPLFGPGPTGPGQTCDPSNLPERLQSGYADLTAFLTSGGASWCPSGTPPAGFTCCHEHLSKDEPDKGHGAERPGPPGNQTFITGETYHTLAVELAMQATAEAWESLRLRIVRRYDSDTVDGECVFKKLAFGGNQSCLRKWGVRLNGRHTIREASLFFERTFTGTADLTLGDDGRFIATMTIPDSVVVTITEPVSCRLTEAGGTCEAQNATCTATYTPRPLRLNLAGWYRESDDSLVFTRLGGESSAGAVVGQCCTPCGCISVAQTIPAAGGDLLGDRGELAVALADGASVSIPVPAGLPGDWEMTLRLEAPAEVGAARTALDQGPGRHQMWMASPFTASAASFSTSDSVG